MKRTTDSKTALALAAVLALAGAAAAQGSQDPYSGSQSGSQSQTSGGSSGSSDSSGQPQMGSSSSQSGTQRDAKSVIGAWPDQTKTAAQSMLGQYGQPDTVLDKKLAWHDKGQWAMVAVYRDAASIPGAMAAASGASGSSSGGQAFIENAVRFKVPANRVAELLKFDSGLVIDQTHGILAANGDSEKANTLVLNLAHDIATGKRTVASARTFYRDTLQKSVSGKSSDYMDRLNFDTSSESSSGSSTIDQKSPSSSGSSGSSSDQATPDGTSTPSGDQSAPSGTQDRNVTP